MFDPNYSPVASNFFALVSVSTSASLVGGLYGVYANATASITLVGIDDTSMDFVIPTGVTLWVQAKYASVVSTTSVIGLR